jgi:hypothetical protein
MRVLRIGAAQQMRRRRTAHVLGIKPIVPAGTHTGAAVAAPRLRWNSDARR